MVQVAMIGAGSMGGGMALLLAENGISVSLQDPSEETVDKLIQSGKDQGIPPLLSKHTDYKSLCCSLGSPKVVIFSLPHGTVGDDVVEKLHPYLVKGDIIIDCSNEKWLNTQRRQGKLVAQGVYYIGCGVSGGYQAARRGPSMCPGGQEAALDMCMPMFEKMAAKDKEGKPCVAKIGMGGCGHYVKMVHNGIEHAMMSGISEAWSILNKHVGMQYDEIGEVFEKWAASGELVSQPSSTVNLFDRLSTIPSWSRSVRISASKRIRRATTFSATSKIKLSKTSMALRERESGPTRKP
jgi:6-phosphogluconate dehydrogenase